ncbi:MAG TPA: Gfo/Idh/MocA family oxidoreductase [Firmicutes bacterium]|nr:Gfo/Idh/MocA family oxidoreductase [Bacillota bacterium]
MKVVRIGMLGAGFVANFYMQGLKDVPGQEVAGVWSRRLDSAQEFASRWAIPSATDDLDRFIARDDIDLYLIALPNFMHKDMALKLAAAKRNMVCTKPLARNAEEAWAMYEAAENAGVMHGYAETEVFAPAVVRAHDIIRSGGIGRVTWVRSREAHSGPHNKWFWDPELAGGGALMDMGCHCIEAARYFFGKDVKPVEVFGWGDTLVHDTKAEDNALAIIRFEGGGIGHLEVSWSARGGLDLRNEIHGTEGAIFTDVTRSTPIEAFTLQSSGYVVEKAEADRGWVIPVPEEAFTYGYQAEMKHFVECVRDGKRPRETFEDGYIVNSIIDAAYASMKSRKWEPVTYRK